MTELDLVRLWMRAFSLTLVVELAVATPLFRPVEASLARRSGIVAIAQLTTHPIVWFVLPALHLPRGAFLTVAEVWAVLGETFVYRLALTRAALGRVLLVSALSNVASFAVGTVFRSALGG